MTTNDRVHCQQFIKNLEVDFPYIDDIFYPQS